MWDLAVAANLSAAPFHALWVAEIDAFYFDAGIFLNGRTGEDCGSRVVTPGIILAEIGFDDLGVLVLQGLKHVLHYQHNSRAVLTARLNEMDECFPL